MTAFFPPIYIPVFGSIIIASGVSLLASLRVPPKEKKPLPDMSKTLETQKRTAVKKQKRFAPTPILDSFSLDFTRLAQEGRIDPIVGRENEIRKLIQTLIRRRKNNVVLVGDPGVGKTAIVEGLARLIASNDVPEILQNKRVVSLQVTKLLSDTKYRGEFEKRINKIIEEISRADRSIILFIDEIHTIIQSHGTEGAVNFADILKPALARGDLQMIGATTHEEYTKFFASNPSLERRFLPIDIAEPGTQETVAILQGVKDAYREYHKVEFTDAALATAVSLSQKNIKTRTLPDKAIDALDEAAAMTTLRDTHPHVHQLLSEAASRAQPDITRLWNAIQKTDTSIGKTKAKKTKATLQKKREALEKTLEKKGIAVVDSQDIQTVIHDWSHGS